MAFPICQIAACGVIDEFVTPRRALASANLIGGLAFLGPPHPRVHGLDFESSRSKEMNDLGSDLHGFAITLDCELLYIIRLAFQGVQRLENSSSLERHTIYLEQLVARLD